MLKESRTPLARTHDLAVLDLDGVLYVGEAVVPGAVDGVEAVVAAGCQVAYVTNNASRTPHDVAAHLTHLGFAVSAEEVVTSAQAAAQLLSARLEPGAAVYAIGGDGLIAALADRGLRPVTTSSTDVAAVAQGYGPDVTWRRISDGAILVRRGLPWVASNTDMTIPTQAGPGPGNGTLVELIARFSGHQPVVAGKPESPLFEQTRDRMAATNPIVVGDRLDTDIAGGRRLGWPTLVVLTGVTGLRQLVAAPPQLRPDYLGVDLSALTRSHRVPVEDGDGCSLGGWHASAAGGCLSIDGRGEVEDWWRVVTQVAWRYLDATGHQLDIADVVVPR